MKNNIPRLRAYDDDDYSPDPVQEEAVEVVPHDPFHPFSRSKGEKARNRKHRNGARK